MVSSRSVIRLSFLYLLQLLLEPVEAGFPEASVVRYPAGDVLKRPGLKTARPPLRGAAPGDQPGALKHFEMLGHGLQAYVEGLGKLVDSRLTSGKAAEDRPPGRVRQCGEGGAELICRHVVLNLQVD